MIEICPILKVYSIEYVCLTLYFYHALLLCFVTVLPRHLISPHDFFCFHSNSFNLFPLLTIRSWRGNRIEKWINREKYRRNTFGNRVKFCLFDQTFSLFSSFIFLNLSSFCIDSYTTKNVLHNTFWIRPILEKREDTTCVYCNFLQPEYISNFFFLRQDSTYLAFFIHFSVMFNKEEEFLLKQLEESTLKFLVILSLDSEILKMDQNHIYKFWIIFESDSFSIPSFSCFFFRL